MNNKKVISFLELIAVFAVIGIIWGMKELINVTLVMIPLGLVMWIFWRILTGSWGVKEWSKNAPKQGTLEEKERWKSFSKFSLKLCFFAIIGTFIACTIVVGIFKLYIFYTKGV